MKGRSESDAPLQDYPDRSVWTTWATSYQSIRDKHESTANLLLLWSYLDNKDLWHGLFAAACEASTIVARMLSEWIGEIAVSKLAFIEAMRLLRNYSLVETMDETMSYATHPVVHRWAYHYQGSQFTSKLNQLTVLLVGWAVPSQSARDSSVVQRRLLPHVQACSQSVATRQTMQVFGDNKRVGVESQDIERRQATLDAMLLLGICKAVRRYLGRSTRRHSIQSTT